jgi:predicted membrane protein
MQEMAMDGNRRPFSSSLVFGVIVLAAGVLLLLGQFGIIAADRVLDFWPMILIAFGLLNLFGSCARGRRVWGGVLVVAGVLLQLENLGFRRVGIQTIWPIFIIGIGVVLVMQALQSKSGGTGGWTNAWEWTKHLRGNSDGNTDARLNYVAIFGGGNARLITKNFQGGDIVAIFGGFDIDLRDAEMEGTEAVITATSIFGGGEIKVPYNWSVAMQGVGLFGGYSEKTRHDKTDAAAPMKTLIIRGVSLFGGVSVKN